MSRGQGCCQILSNAQGSAPQNVSSATIGKPRCTEPCAGVVVCGDGVERLRGCRGTWCLDGGRPGRAVAERREPGGFGKAQGENEL